MTLVSAHYRLATIGCWGMSIFIFTYLLASTPSRIASRLGRRGMRRMEALARNETWRSFEPLIRWMGVRLSNVLPDGMRSKLDRQILYAGDYLGLLPEEYVALMFIGSFGGAVFGYMLGRLTELGVMPLFGFGVLGLVLPYIQISAEQQERFLKVTRGLPYAVDLLTLSLSAGLDFPGAVRQVVTKGSPDDPLVDEFGYMLQQLQLGNTRRQVLLEFAERVPTESVKEFANTVIQAEEKGNPLANTLAIQSTVSRQRRTTLAEETAAKAGVKMVGPLGLMLVTVMIIVLAPTLMKVMKSLDTDFGRKQ